MSEVLRKYFQSLSLSCGFFLAVIAVLYVVMTFMRAENAIRRTFAVWIHD